MEQCKDRQCADGEPARVQVGEPVAQVRRKRYACQRHRSGETYYQRNPSRKEADERSTTRAIERREQEKEVAAAVPPEPKKEGETKPVVDLGVVGKSKREKPQSKDESAPESKKQKV